MEKIRIKEAMPLCTCGHGAHYHAEFVDRAPTSKNVEEPVLRHCLFGYSSSKGFSCDCYEYRSK